MSIAEPTRNWRLQRIAHTICVCDMTDGFCGPENRPDCRCWTMARLAVQGLRNVTDPALKEAWPEMDAGQARQHLYKLCHAILSRRDDLTEQFIQDNK